MIEKIETLLDEIKSLSANDEKEVEALRIKYLSKKGVINDLMTDFRSVPASDKREIGMKLNELKTLRKKRSTACARTCVAMTKTPVRWT